MILTLTRGALLGGTSVQLTGEEIKYLDEPYKPQDFIGHT